MCGATFLEKQVGRAQRDGRSADHSTVVDGVVYWLNSPDQLRRFNLDPERYLPAHGGWCTLMMGGSGRRTAGHPENYAMVDDRLMLFWSGDTPATKGMGLKNWRSKTEGKIELERAWVADADEQWGKFFAGFKILFEAQAEGQFSG